MGEETEDTIYEIVNQIPITEENREQVEEIKHAVRMKNYKRALLKIEELNNERNTQKEEEEKEKAKEVTQKTGEVIYPKELSDEHLEYTYMGLLLENPKSISRYYFLYKECYFEDEKKLESKKCRAFNFIVPILSVAVFTIWLDDMASSINEEIRYCSLFSFGITAEAPHEPPKFISNS